MGKLVSVVFRSCVTKLISVTICMTSDSVFSRHSIPLSSVADLSTGFLIVCGLLVTFSCSICLSALVSVSFLLSLILTYLEKQLWLLSSSAYLYFIFLSLLVNITLNIVRHPKNHFPLLAVLFWNNFLFIFSVEFSTSSLCSMEVSGRGILCT